MDNKRVFIEKKDLYNVEAANLLREFKDYLCVHNLEQVRVINVYDIQASDSEYKQIIENLLFEALTDSSYEELLLEAGEKAFRIVSHKGQFNQREDSSNEIVKKFLNMDDANIKHSKIIVLKNINDEEFEKIKAYYINPIEYKEIELNYLEKEAEAVNAKEIEIVNNFIGASEKEVEIIKDEVGLGMDMEDLLYCQSYFKSENRDPSIAELKVIDTYWSDHCRHTTFMTEITNISIDDGAYKQVFEEALNEYFLSKKSVYKDEDRATCLMDLATINMKEIKKKGLLDDKEESDEVNAASIEIDVDVNGKNERYLLMFKNETHNHPTEIEPFGGAATCLGGGIRDPLSGRAYVYQAMRITGADDPREKFEDTLAGKLPQRKITKTAMEGYSSYGNQIGGTSGYIKEFYDEGFKAKRMELGALVAAVPKDWVLRGNSEPSDLILLVGGRTGRDGLGAAVGSSKVQTGQSLEESGAEVQKGNPILERKIVRLFRTPQATRIIKKCNDFGAGGVAVAVGELADGLDIQLDKVPVKYDGMDGGEIALSESQERMAVVIDRENLEQFMELVESEDLEASVIAEVTDKGRLQMTWKGKQIIDIDRDFLNTNGIRKKAEVKISMPKGEIYLHRSPEHIKNESIKEDFINNLKELNVASQKGLIEKFDNTIGSGTVIMQLGGKHMLTPQEGMVAKIPVPDGETNTCSIMTCGYDPKLAKWSTFHGGYYAVIDSIAKIVALGGDYRKVRLTFQEYYERLGDNPNKWGKPFSSLLGAFLVQKALDIPSIGGKDSMSGSYEGLDVPPSLISFGVTYDKVHNIVSKEFKKSNSQVAVINLDIDDNGLVNLKQLKNNYSKIKNLIDTNKILSASSISYGGMARTITEMSLGNKVGFSFNENAEEKLFRPLYGSIILEIAHGENPEELLEGLSYTSIGKTIDEERIEIGNEILELNELLQEWEQTLTEIFPIERDEVKEDKVTFNKGESIIRKSPSIGKPRVLIPVFTGTHGEYDMAKEFERAGAIVDTFIFNSLSVSNVQDSYKELSRRIKEAQIIGLPNGQIYGDEPETGGKLLKLIFNNPYIKEAINQLLSSRDGLMLGIGEGAIGLIKTGLIQHGNLSDLDSEAAFITHNKNGSFVSTMADIKVVSNTSPWMNFMEAGECYTVPVATKEGRIILNDAKLSIDNGQIATQFASINPTGSDIAAESLTSPDGRILAAISSIDRTGDNIYKNIDIKGKHKIFESGVKYFI